MAGIQRLRKGAVVRGIIAIVLLTVWCGLVLGQSVERNQSWTDIFSDESKREQEAKELLLKAQRLYYQEEKLDDLIETYEKAIAILEKEWGEENPYVLNMQYNLQNIYWRKLDYAKIAKILKKTWRGAQNNDRVSDEFKGLVAGDLGNSYLIVGLVAGAPEGSHLLVENAQMALPLLTNSLSLLESAWGRDDERLDSVRDSIKRCEGMLPETEAAASDRSVESVRSD